MSYFLILSNLKFTWWCSSACIVSAAIIATNGNLAVEDRPWDKTSHSKWKCIARQMPDALNGCLCRIVMDSQSDGVLECKRLGCETQWVRQCSIQEKLKDTHSLTFQYHLHCILLEIVPWNWVCGASEASGTSRGTKQSWWWHHLTIYGYVPDYIGR